MSIYAVTPRRATSAKRSGANTAPVNFDPGTHPILAVHYFGLEPPHPIGQIAAVIVADMKFRRQVERLHGLGPRAIAELLAELAAERSIMTAIDQKLATYVSIDPEVIGAAGGSDFWPAPLHLIRIAGSSGNRAITRDSTA